MAKKAYSVAEPSLKKSIVCFVDILGFSQLSDEALKNNQGNEFLLKLRNALSKSYKEIRRFSRGWKDKELFSIKVFTDNIVVGYPLDSFEYDFGESELAQIFRVFQTFQMNLAIEGFLSRGGISVGDHYMNDDIVFGDALLNAVKKDKGGGPPYISLDSNATEILRRHLGFYGDSANYAPQRNYLLEDADGTIFINYLAEALIGFPESEIFFDLFESHKKTITSGLYKYMTDPGVRAKYEWAARYHNFVCNDTAKQYSTTIYKEDYEPLEELATQEAQKLLEYKIDIEALSSSPQRLTLKPIPPKLYR